MAELTIKLTEKMVFDRQHCNEDSDCSECSCCMANDECLFNFTEERKVGKWIDGHCTNCGCDVPAYIIDWEWKKDMDAKWCPQCGAEMEGSENG